MNKKELNDYLQINDALHNLYQTVFKENLSLTEEWIQNFLDKVSLNENQTLQYEVAITESEFLKALTFMDNDKPPGKDGIANELFIKF